MRNLPRIAQLMAGAWLLEVNVWEQINTAYDMILAGQRIELAEDELFEAEGRSYTVTKNGTAYIPVMGLIAEHGGLIERSLYGGTSPSTIENQLFQAMGDDAVQDVLMIFDTPGGNADRVFALADLIHDMDSNDKPIHAFVYSACSAGTLLASACRTITLHEDVSTMGSIGVAMRYDDDSQAEKAEGVISYHISIPAGKRMLTGEMTGEKRAEIIRQLTPIYDAFVGRVSAFRGVSVQDLYNMDGKVFSGNEVIDLGLADRILALWNLEKSVNVQSHKDGGQIMFTSLTKRIGSIFGSDDPKQLEAVESAISEGLPVEVTELAQTVAGLAAKMETVTSQLKEAADLKEVTKDILIGLEKVVYIPEDVDPESISTFLVESVAKMNEPIHSREVQVSDPERLTEAEIDKVLVEAKRRKAAQAG